MSLTDILEGALTIAGAAVVIYGFKKLMREHYIPWTKEIQKEFDKEPDKYDCRIDGKE